MGPRSRVRGYERTKKGGNGLAWGLDNKHGERWT